MHTAYKPDCQSQLKELNRRLTFIEQTNQLGYWELDITQKSMFWSPEMYNIFGLPQSYNKKRNFIREQLCIQDIKLYKEKLYQLLTNRQPVEAILRIRSQDSQLMYCQFHASIENKESREFIIGTLQNISKYIKTQQEEQNQSEKTYSYAKISHDLRQPLQALKIFIALLKEENLTSEQLILTERIENSVDNLSSWLDNILEAAKLEAGAIKRQNKVFNLNILLDRLGEEYKEIATYKHIEFAYGGQNIRVNNDSVLLERIIRNLLSNALKYTKNQVRMRWYKTNRNIKIIIKDNGRGLLQEVERNLFQAFYQNDKHRHKGTGLGLAIVKELADILNISINIKSKLNKGSIIVLSLHNIS